MGLDIRILDKLASRPALNSLSTNGRAASRIPWPAQAASRAAAYDENRRCFGVTFSLKSSASQAFSQAASLTLGDSRFCFDHHAASKIRASATTGGAAARTSFTASTGV